MPYRSPWFGPAYRSDTFTRVADVNPHSRDRCLLRRSVTQGIEIATILGNEDRIPLSRGREMTPLTLGSPNGRLAVGVRVFGLRVQ